MIKVVERPWLDIMKIGLGSEMKTASMDTLVERLLPNALKRAWVLNTQNIADPSDLFESLLNFLLTETKVCEYLESDLRSISTKVTTHSVMCEDTEKKNIKDTLHEIKLVQHQQHAMISECLSAVSKSVSGFPGDSKIQNVKMCWDHGLQEHTIHDCYTLKKKRVIQTNLIVSETIESVLNV